MTKSVNRKKLVTKGQIYAAYIVSTGATIRETAKVYNKSKTNVHYHITKLDPESDIYKEVKKVLEKNKEERHIRGGIATKKYYEERNKSLD